MLSLHQAIEIKESISAYLKATYSFQDQEVQQAFHEFVHHPTHGMFKGPYLSLKLPFVKAQASDIEHIPLSIQPDWLPYDHQIKAWKRLSTQKGHSPQPTLITTGTGSGKTEAFLYPILDYCYQQREKRGIKVIILYPMNALASDQAKRLAEAIAEDERLEGKITAGLFIGEGKDPHTYPRMMGKDHIIENRESILASPPDILLTNFKMLDYGLLKSSYHDLWTFNLKQPELLRFLVLDELHTYDGAQGTDVANLIRRLKLKLNIPKGYLCPIGTSATIGSGEEAPQLLSQYASKIFGEQVDPQAIITENRVSVDDFFGEVQPLDDRIPSVETLFTTSLHQGQEVEPFIDAQLAAWELKKEGLADQLRGLSIVKDMVEVCQYQNGISTLDEIALALSRKNRAFQQLPEQDEKYPFSPRIACLESIIALITEAKLSDKRASPFLYTQVQLWVRELSGILRVIDEKPTFVWKEYAQQSQDRHALPPWYCRECGASGWLTIKHDDKDQLSKNIRSTYDYFFSHHKDLYFSLPTNNLSLGELSDSGYEASDAEVYFIDPESLVCEEEEEDTLVPILMARKFKKTNKTKQQKGLCTDHTCPACNSKNTLNVIGAKVTTLSSISMSQTLATDLNPQLARERKVLAFTNSVQDAAHQAGYVEARNYRFTFRASLQKVIQSLPQAVPLDQLAQAFQAYWKQHADDAYERPLDAYYSRFFPKNYLNKYQPADFRVAGQYTERFAQEFDMRMEWEVLAEFGFNALLGRTLEKTLSAGTHFPQTLFQQSWRAMQEWIQHNLCAGSTNGQAVSEHAFSQFLFLILHRLRAKGAIAHPFLHKYRTHLLKFHELNWYKDSKHLLPPYFDFKARLPKLITFQSEKKGLLETTFSKNGQNWYHQYFIKCFPQANHYKDSLNEFYEELLNQLGALGFMDQQVANEVPNFALQPSHLLVSAEVYDLQCNSCGHKVYTSDPEGIEEGGKCLTYRCLGTYERKHEAQQPNYYQGVYHRKRSPRIYAADHTGLLERKRREELERDFKERNSFHSPNALIATSTLEMGIDIGSLDNAYNNAIPPLPANFLQRIGRAGRASGSALIVNFVHNKPHDLYYFQDPIRMMAGEVMTPGCYLEAKDILRRHFFAYCIDSWTKEAPHQHHIPPKVEFLKLAPHTLQHPDFFMNQILAYIRGKQSYLLSAFQEQYDAKLMAPIFTELKELLMNESFDRFYLRIFEELQEEIADIQQKKVQIQARMEKLAAQDQERVDLLQESKHLGNILRGIYERNLLAHLTNAGALPNYAFPETGVVLGATVMKAKPKESDQAAEYVDFEIVRSARNAIREFAPDNHFYSQKYKFRITGVNTHDWADKEVFHQKRFCSNCDHMALVLPGEEQAQQCPKCGDESWRSPQNVHMFAKLVSVKSFNHQFSASLDDTRDERTHIRYHLLDSFAFDPAYSKGSWALKEVSFGIEFVKQVQITQMNLGNVDQRSGEKVRIDRKEFPASGFITCKHCGKSTSLPSKVEKQKFHSDFHYAYCPHKQKDYQGEPDEIFEEVFFFREVKTEALKILIPIQELQLEEDFTLFQAGIQLGLKRYFKGNPQHIALAKYQEFNRKTQRFDKFLILYDTIPGGTGYLEKLFDPDAFSRLLQGAHEAIRDCSCALDHKDGCYQCVLSYNNQYDHGTLSRNRAEKLFGQIVHHIGEWELLSSGLSDITASGKLEESELEDRLIHSLRLMAKERSGNWTFREHTDRKRISYSLSFKDEQHSFHYLIQPQVELGKAQGIPIFTRVDFLIRCTSAVVRGKDLTAQIPHMAIYMDGYQYHASEYADPDQFYRDARNRMAISASPNHICWTLTWQDMDLFDAPFKPRYKVGEEKDYLGQSLEHSAYRNSWKKIRGVVKKRIHLDIGEAHNSLERLLALLSYPIQDSNFHLTWSSFLAYYQKQVFVPSFAPEDVSQALDTPTYTDHYYERTKNPDTYVLFQALPDNPLFEGRTVVNLVQRKVLSRIRLHPLTDIGKEDWNLYWIYANIIQLFPFEEWVDPAAIAFSAASSPAPAPAGPSADTRIEEILPLYDPPYHGLLRAYHQAFPIATEEDELALTHLIDMGTDKVLAEAELILHPYEIVFEPHSEKEAHIFRANGYEIKTVEQINDVQL